MFLAGLVFFTKHLKSHFYNQILFLVKRTFHNSLLAMHILQPKHTKLKTEEVKKLLEKYNISISQLPKIKSSDPAVPEGSLTGDVLKIERKEEDKINVYYRVVV